MAPYRRVRTAHSSSAVFKILLAILHIKYMSANQSSVFQDITTYTW